MKKNILKILIIILLLTPFFSHSQVTRYKYCDYFSYSNTSVFYDRTAKTCTTGTTTSCTSPQFRNIVDNTCVSQSQCANNFGLPNSLYGECYGLCTPPQTFDSSVGGCITPSTCPTGSFINIINNICVTADYCKAQGISCYGSCPSPQIFDSSVGGCIEILTENKPHYSKLSNLFIQTDDSKNMNITQTTATLSGMGGDKIATPTLPITAYFRYSKAKKNPPIYCNDIYGTNMSSTKDYKLGAVPPTSFSQKITGLKPDTTYYYCAIISNKENIAYGGEAVVKSFHTSPLETTIRTTDATRITSTTATINGTYSSVKTIKTYFQYKEADQFSNQSFNSVKDSIKDFFLKILVNTALAFDPNKWTKINEQTHTIGNYSNLYGNINFTLSKLKPSTKYFFRAVVNEDYSKRIPLTTVCPTGWSGKWPDCTSYGTTLSFTTSATPKDTNIDLGGTGWESYCTNGATNYPTCDNNNYIPTCNPPYILNESKTSCIYNNLFPTVTVTPSSYTFLPSYSYVTINWTSTNATSCTFDDGVTKTRVQTSSELNNTVLSGQGITTRPNVFHPITSTVYSVSCTGAYGTVSGNSFIYVNTGGGNNDNSLLPSITVTANPSSVSSNGSSNISWTSTNATSCDAGIESVKVSGTWNSIDNGKSGVWSSGSGSGTWTNTTGTGGTGDATWFGTGGTKTWTSKTGSGTWMNTTGSGMGSGIWSNRGGTTGSFNTGALTSSKSYSISCTGAHGTVSGNAFIYVNTGGGNWTNNGDTGTWTNGTWTTGNYTNGVWTNTGTYTNGSWTNGNSNNNTNYTNKNGIINTAPLTLGQKATPRSDDVVRYHEGIETVFSRQIVADKEFAKRYGYEEGNDLQNFAWYLSDQFARMFGYVNESGKEIRVSLPDVAAYQLQLNGNKLTVYEYYYNRIIDIRNISATLKNASDYEYYFKKR